jgi:hypothetical protein
MDVLQPTFMLLPDFAFLPDKDVLLGSILPTTKDSKRPDPRRPLTARVPVVSDDISEQAFEPWAWDSDKSSSTSGGVFADLSIITGIGAGVEGSHGNTTGLTIKCERVDRSTFHPSSTSISGAMADDTISRILKKFTRPSIYIVTGLMVAHEASIEVKKSKNIGGGAHASVNVTQTGVPINTGVKGEIKRDENSTLTQVPKSSFILAYQLLRIRRKLLDQSLDTAEENKWALFNDDAEADSSTARMMDELQVDPVTDELEWDDNGASKW